jgi:hypothetical protein
MFVIVMVFSWCLDLCNNAKQNITMFHHFLNARVPVCRLYQLFFYNFVEILIIYNNIRVDLGGIICYYKGNLMLISN